MALWNGRFSEDINSLLLNYSESISYDQRLYPYDIQGSIAHAKMLGQQGIISSAEADEIIAGLQKIKNEIDAGDFIFKTELEDIHMNIEARLTELIGPVGAKLHSGRSRNDQIATDERLFLRAECDILDELLLNMQRSLHSIAAKYPDVIMPGFTHLQHAQPVLFAHHLLAYIEMFNRDRERLQDAKKRINRLPLGAGALAGSSLPLNREAVAQELAFDDLLYNSMDAVADRDFLLEFLSCLAICSMHISRIAEDVIIWYSQEFAFIELGDAFTTGSSLMPQKKNPDIAELARGKTGRVYGHLMALLTTLKGLPLTYNRDMQEDKEGLFDALDTVKMTLETFAAMLSTLKPVPDKMLQQASDPFLMATDLAEWLVKKGVPFRDAHKQVGRFVADCLENEKCPTEMSLQDMQKSIPQANEECLKLWNPLHSVKARNLTGGTAPEQVKKRLEFWEKGLN